MYSASKYSYVPVIYSLKVCITIYVAAVVHDIIIGSTKNNYCYHTYDILILLCCMLLTLLLYKKFLTLARLRGEGYCSWSISVYPTVLIFSRTQLYN